jgi:ABC transporter substrate binding protein
LKRREFIALLGGATALWPLAARAQQTDRMRRIGVLIPMFSQTDREGQARIAAFLDTFQRLGWTDGRNVRIEFRWGAGDTDRANASVAELLRSSPDVIVFAGNQALAELHRLTSTIPIVFTQVSDPVDSGFVAGLARPGGNITGFQNFEPAMGGKWLGVLKEAAPNLSRVAVLFGSDSAANVASCAWPRRWRRRWGSSRLPSTSMTVSRSSARSPRLRASRMAVCSLCRIPTPWRTVHRSSYWPRGIACRRSIRTGISQSRAA